MGCAKSTVSRNAYIDYAVSRNYVFENISMYTNSCKCMHTCTVHVYSCYMKEIHAHSKAVTICTICCSPYLFWQGLAFTGRGFFHREALQSFAIPFQNNCMERNEEKLSQPAIKKIRLKNKLKAYPITTITMTFFKTGLSCPQGNFSRFLFNPLFGGNFVEFLSLIFQILFKEHIFCSAVRFFFSFEGNQQQYPCYTTLP